MGPLDYQLLLAEIRAMRKELESQFDGLRQSFNKPASTAIATTSSPPTVQLSTPYHDDSIASDQIRVEGGLTSNVPVALLDVVHEPAPVLDTTSTDEHNPGPAAIQAMLDAAESPHRLAAALDDLVRLSLLPDVLLCDIVSRLPIKDTARTAVLSRRWRPLCASPSVSLVEMEAQPFFLIACTKQERRPIIRAEGMGASGRVFVGVNIQRLHDDFAPDDPSLLHCVCLGPVMCVLRATPLGGYDGSLDDDLESGITHFDAPLDRAIGRDGQAPPAAATLRPDAVGAAGGGLLAWVMAARTAQAICSMICPASDSSFADVPIGALWEEEMLRWSTTGGLGDVLGGLPPAMAAKGSHGMTWSTHVAEATPTSSTTSTLPGASTPSPAMLSSISLEHASSGARQVFEEWSLHADIFCNICIGFELPSRMSLGVNQHQPCPPTHVQVEFGCGSADVRPLPWPSFTLGNCCSVSQAVCWKPPWPLPSLQGVRIGIGAMLCLFPVVAWLPHWLCFHFLWKPPWQLPALVIPTYSVQLKRGGLTQFDSHSLFHVFGISCWGLLAEMRPISSMVLLLSIFGHSANMLVLDGPVTLVGILGWCRFPRCFLLLSSIWPVKKERQLLGSGLVLNLVGYSNMHMLTFELRSIPMQLIKYASVHFLPSAPNSILVSLKCGNHLKLEVSVPVYKFNSNIMLLHQFTTTVQAPPIGAMWLLLAINSLAHEEFQFGFEIEKMMRTTVMVLLHIFTMEASGNHLISFPEILNWAWERWISIFLAQVDLFRLVPWDPGGLQLLLSVSMAGCALIQQRVQRKCGGNCRCFLLEVTGQNFPVATPCIKCKVFCREFILLDMGFLTTNKEVQCNVDCFSSTYSEEEFLQFPWDPGGSELLHRLGGKPNFKKGGMSGICVGWTAMWGRTVRQKQRQGQASTKGQDGKRKGIEELFRRLPSHSTFYCSSSFRSLSLLYLDSLLPVPSRTF